ncbi:glucose dehydrogenase short protein [Mycena olivaceomarginata]|nr:glucose dehydrogenase short protein [Mycena olivaceomarginata]
MFLSQSLLILTFLLGDCFAKIYEDVSDLPSLEYDFVIVGGGTAGNVVANRLTENPNFSVLVLEAGVSNEGVLDSTVPYFVENLLAAPGIYGWNYTTTPQIGLNNRVLPYQRAHILGGCSAHNGMVYTRGSAEDFDRYASKPTLFENEKWTQPADHHDARGQFNPAVHSTDGINSVKFPEEFPFNLDFNSGQMLGVGTTLFLVATGWLQSTIGGGKRSTSATSYLAPNFIQRNNLHVLLQARVSRLVDPGKTIEGAVTFGGVEFLQGNGSLFTAKATKEIILSAGSVGTPTVLMHSGIGDEKALTALGIPSVLDLPSVGQNATDQPLVSAGWLVNLTQTMDSITENATRYAEAYAEWNATHTGPFVELPATHLAWMRLDVDSPIFENVTDPAPGPNTTAYRDHTCRPFSAGPQTGNFISFALVVLTPISRGSVTIESNNPFDPPLIDVGMLTTDFDIFTIRESIKRAYRFVQAPTWKDYIISPIVDLLNMSTDALDEYIRNNAGFSSHLVSTAAMSAADASYGVVNPDLLVKGVTRLSIIDASILPFTTSAHTQAAAYVVGERGADMVKQRWK